MFDADAAVLLVRGGDGVWRVTDDIAAARGAGGGGGAPWRPVSVGSGLTGRALGAMAPLACNEVEGSSVFDAAADVAGVGAGGGGAFMVAPVPAAGSRRDGAGAAAAVVQVACRRGTFSSLDVRLLQCVAAGLTMALRQCSGGGGGAAGGDAAAGPCRRVLHASNIYELSMLAAGVLADTLGVSEATLLPFDATRREVRDSHA